jgi:signal transduction histidine kinase
LGAIILKAMLIEKGMDDAKLRRHAGSITAIATRTEAFIQKLLDAASIEAGRLSLAYRRCAVGDLLDATTETFGPLAAEKSITLELHGGNRGLAFWGDPERIGQVLSNLAGNALKFTPEGGRVTIRAVESGFHTRIEVRDTGPGIASQHLPRVFDRFWRADGEGRKGTGLGLYIAKGIVETHHGRIWAESRVGAGTAFIFELPIAAPTGAANASPAERQTNSQPERGGEIGEHPDR